MVSASRMMGPTQASSGCSDASGSSTAVVIAATRDTPASTLV
jgi:hypothetical protein